MSNPLISIIIPTYNRAHVIEETLDSVLVQTYSNWECIVIDDGSTDHTDAILKDYCKKNPRFQFHHRPKNRPKGACACRNYGFELSKGEYINWLDSDDLFFNTKIELQLLEIEKSKADIATCKWGRFSNKENFKIKELSIYKTYNKGEDLLVDYGLFSSYFPSHTFLIKRNIVTKSGLWNEKLSINQDGEFFCRVLLKTGKVTFANETYVLYRSHLTDNISNVNTLSKAKDLILSWKMIIYNLERNSSVKFEKYIYDGLDYCHFRLKDNYKTLIFENEKLFKKHIKENSILNRFLKKLF